MADPGLHGRPTAVELLEAVREFLDAEVLPVTEGRLRFHVRVAANALAIVERELRLGTELEAAHRRALERLGVASEAELARAIRAGTLDGRSAEVLEVVRETVRARLLVANPDHLDPPRAAAPDG